MSVECVSILVLYTLCHLRLLNELQLFTDLKGYFHLLESRECLSLGKGSSLISLMVIPFDLIGYIFETGNIVAHGCIFDF